MKLLLLLLVSLPLRAEFFVSSHDANQVLRFNETSGAFIDVFIPNIDNRLQAPHGLAFGRDDNLYVASAGNDSVLRYNSQTGAFIDAFIPAGSGGLDYPVALIFHNQHLYVSSQLNDRVLRYNALTGAFVDIFIQSAGELDGPSDMIFGPGDNLYVVGRFNNRVVRYFGTGALDRVFVSTDLSQPFGLRILPFVEFPENRLIIASGDNNAVHGFGAFTGSFKGVYASTNLNFPIGLELGPDENIYVASYGNDRIVRFNGRTGAYVDDFIPAGSGGLNGPNFMVFRPPPRPTLNIART